MPDTTATTLGAPQIGRPLAGRLGTSRPDVHPWQQRSRGRPTLAVGLLHVPEWMSVREWVAARGMISLRTAQCGYRLLETFDVTDHPAEVEETMLAVDRLVTETSAVAVVVAGPFDSARLRDLLVRSRAELVRLPYEGEPDPSPTTTPPPPWRG